VKARVRPDIKAMIHTFQKEYIDFLADFIPIPPLTEIIMEYLLPCIALKTETLMLESAL
jgi:hypothetical protein